MHDYLSFARTVVLSRSDAVLALGRELTKQLDLDQSVDTLGRWMAHYIAELIYDAENATAEERPLKLQICSDAVLQLWQHRHELPNGKRPFQELESILKALEDLDPDSGSPRYFRSIRNATGLTEDADAEAMLWLKLVDGLDDSAKLLIRHCLLKAAQTSLDKSARWVALAEAAGAPNGIESSLVRVLVNDHSLLHELDEEKAAREIKLDRTARLESFVALAQALISELNA
jgi:hypothetical protein